jgi:hypothetical protein
MTFSTEDLEEIKQVGEAVYQTLHDMEPEPNTAISALSSIIGMILCATAGDKAELKRFVLRFTKEFKKGALEQYERVTDPTIH